MYSERFKIYKEEVVAVFLEKREKAQELWLIRLTRNRIRDQIITLIEERVEPGDHLALSDYLQMKSDDTDYLSAIKKTDADDFQGFLRFLQDTSINPSEDTIELLAWLIRFPSRPFAVYLDLRTMRAPEKADKKLKEDIESAPPVDNGEQEKSKAVPEETNVSEERDQTKKPIKEPVGDPGRRPNLWLYGAGIFILIILLIIWWLQPKDDCMYWSEDHYVASPCSPPKLDTQIISIDRARLRDFRRIKNVDTITSYAVGRYWYYRFPNTDSIEVYTARGTNPLHPDKELKKVTDYIVNVCHNKYHSH